MTTDASGRDRRRARLHLATLPALLGVLACAWAGVLEPLDALLLDGVMRHGHVAGQDRRVVLVYVTDRTREVLGLPSTVPRRLLAEYLRKVASLGARAQIFDLFLWPRGAADAADEEELLVTARRLGNVAFLGLQVPGGFQCPLSGQIHPPDFTVGITQAVRDGGGSLREAPLFLQAPGWPLLRHISLEGLRLADPAVGGEPTSDPHRPWYLAPGAAVRIGNRLVPTFGPAYSVWFDFVRPEEGRPLFETWTFEDFMRFRNFDGKPFEGRLVILGSNEMTQHDLFTTPVGPQWGPSLNAQLVTALLDDRFLRPIGLHVVAALCVLSWLAAVSLYVRFRPLAAALAAAATSVGLLGLFAICYAEWSLWLPVAAPLLVNLATAAVVTLLRARDTEEERRFIRETFSRYAPRQIVDHLMADSARLRLGGEAQEVSILFADINGFTGITEQQGPEETIEMLNSYFARMTKVIFRHEGLIKQFVGDEIMVIFGAPVYCEDHAARALATAWEMREEVARLRQEREAAGKPGFDVKFGLNSGIVVLGNIGSPERMEYGAVGDVVNAASRIMNLNKSQDVRTGILVGERTAKLGGAGFELAELGTFTVKGKAETLRVFELRACAPAPSAAPARTP